MQFTDFTLYSGGAKGSDHYWDQISRKHGVHSINHYYIEGFRVPYGNVAIPKDDPCLKIADKALIEVNNQFLRRKFPTNNQYVNALLRRNYWQIKDTIGVYAIGERDSEGIILGGTAWACYMAILKKKPVLFFDQNKNYWHYWDYKINNFVQVNQPPYLYKRFTGIGTRRINKNGERAIKEVFEKTKKIIEKP